MTDWEIDWEFKYEALRDSIRAACQGIGCHNAHQLRQAIDLQREAVRLLSEELKFVLKLLHSTDFNFERSDAVQLNNMAEAIDANPIAAKAMREDKP